MTADPTRTRAAIRRAGLNPDDDGIAGLPAAPRVEARNGRHGKRSGAETAPGRMAGGGGGSPEPVAAGDHDTISVAAKRALSREDWPTLIKLTEQLRDIEPDDPSGYWMGVQALRESRKGFLADRLSAVAEKRFPDSIEILIERAKVLSRRGHHEPALQRYRKLMAVQPESPMSHLGVAMSLMYLGQLDEADDFLGRSLERFPNHVALLASHVICARRRLDLTAARARLEILWAVAPESAQYRNLANSVQMTESATSATTGGEADDVRSVVASVYAGDGQADIFQRFESIGANCEFGLVQRAAGIEPLGLLRFSGTDIERLSSMLEARCDTVGDPANLGISLNRALEYVLTDNRYFHTHTFINRGAEDEETIFQKLCKRTVFLRDKLLRDIREGRKILMFNHPDGGLEDARVFRLHAAVRALGPAPLVCVSQEAGTGVGVAAKPDGLFVANLPANIEISNLRSIGTPAYADRYNAWLTICQAVVAAVASGGASP